MKEKILFFKLELTTKECMFKEKALHVNNT